MDSNRKDQEKWFKNVEKNENGVNVTVIPIDPETNTKITTSSNHMKYNIMNATDNNPMTKWSSNYDIKIFKDDFYTNKQITQGSYSRGKIVRDGKNKNIILKKNNKNKNCETS